MKLMLSMKPDSKMLFDVTIFEDGEIARQSFSGYGQVISRVVEGRPFLVFPIVRNRGGSNEYSVAIDGVPVSGDGWFREIVTVEEVNERGVLCRVGVLRSRRHHSFPLLLQKS